MIIRKPFRNTIFWKVKKEVKKRGKMEATLSIIDNLIKNNATDWQFIASTTGVDQQQYVEMQKEYQQLEAARL